MFVSIISKSPLTWKISINFTPSLNTAIQLPENGTFLCVPGGEFA